MARVALAWAARCQRAAPSWTWPFPPPRGRKARRRRTRRRNLPRRVRPTRPRRCSRSTCAVLADPFRQGEKPVGLSPCHLITLSSHPLSSDFRRWLARQLLGWFERSQRDLPWRHDRDPYRIWLSEVMLQQTQVATVVPYFERFLKRFPTLSDLATADEQEVLRLWEGLGYYRRARNLHRAARHLRDGHDGVFPSDPAALDGVPSMGRYTVNAVLSQAFDLRLPILEANSQRVLCRLFGRTEDPTRNPLKKWLWQTAEEVLPRRH